MDGIDACHTDKKGDRIMSVGSAKYQFSFGEVVIYRDDGYSPRDSDLAAVQAEMESMIAEGDYHLTFNVGELLRVEIKPSVRAILQEAVKPLANFQRIHR